MFIYADQMYKAEAMLSVCVCGIKSYCCRNFFCINWKKLGFLNEFKMAKLLKSCVVCENEGKLE